LYICLFILPWSFFIRFSAFCANVNRQHSPFFFKRSFFFGGFLNFLDFFGRVTTGFKTFCPFGRKCGGTGIPDGIPDGRLDGYFGR